MTENGVRQRAGVAYGLGQLLDVYEPEHPRGAPVVLLWHGRGANERGVLEPLARRIAASGVTTVVPDWSADDGGIGRHDLTASLTFTHDLVARLEAGPVVLAGWSLGANAGLDAVLLSTIIGAWRPTAFVGLSGDFADSPFMVQGLHHAASDPSVPLLLIHGTADEVVPVQRSRDTFASLHHHGWRIALREVGTDHAGVIGTIYDPRHRRCVPTGDPTRQALLTTVAGWIADIASTV